MISSIILPEDLVQAVIAQRCVLFLGAGASMEAIDSAGKHPPSGAGLRTIVGQHFYGKPMEGYDLISLAEIAIQAHTKRSWISSLVTNPSPRKNSRTGASTARSEGSSKATSITDANALADDVCSFWRNQSDGIDEGETVELPVVRSQE